MNEYCEICNSYHDKETKMVPMHRRAEKIRDENIRLREQLAEAQVELGNAGYIITDRNLRIKRLKAELKEAQGRITHLSQALLAENIGRNLAKRRIEELEGVLLKAQSYVGKTVYKAIENALQRKKDV